MGSFEENKMAISGRVVLTPEEPLPYKVVLQHKDGADSEHEVGSVRAGEAMIRDNLPEPPAPELLRQWTSRP